MKKYIASLLLLLTIVSTGLAQNVDTRTRNIVTAKYLGARDAYQKADYQLALEKLTEIDALLKNTSTPVLPTSLNLKVKTLIALKRFSDASKALNTLEGLPLNDDILKNISHYHDEINNGLEAEKKQLEAEKQQRIEAELARQAALKEQARKARELNQTRKSNTAIIKNQLALLEPGHLYYFTGAHITDSPNEVDVIVFYHDKYIIITIPDPNIVNKLDKDKVNDYFKQSINKYRTEVLKYKGDHHVFRVSEFNDQIGLAWDEDMTWYDKEDESLNMNIFFYLWNKDLIGEISYPRSLNEHVYSPYLEAGTIYKQANFHMVLPEIRPTLVYDGFVDNRNMEGGSIQIVSGDNRSIAVLLAVHHDSFQKIHKEKGTSVYKLTKLDAYYGYKAYDLPNGRFSFLSSVGTEVDDKVYLPEFSFDHFYKTLSQLSTYVNSYTLHHNTDYTQDMSLMQDVVNVMNGKDDDLWVLAKRNPKPPKNNTPKQNATAENHKAAAKNTSTGQTTPQQSQSAKTGNASSTNEQATTNPITPGGQEGSAAQKTAEQTHGAEEKSTEGKKDPDSASDSAAAVEAAIIQAQTEEIKAKDKASELASVKKDYDQACKIDTKASVQKFIADHTDSDSKYVKEAKSVLKCFDVKSLSFNSGDLKEVQLFFTRVHFYTHLTSLSISDLFFQLPENIGELKSLKYLSIQSGRILKFPASFWNLHNLISLKLKDDHITFIPEGIKNLQNLQTIDLSGNQLKSLPYNTCFLDKLIHLNSAGNQLSSVPDQIGGLQNLQTLDLGKNQLVSLPGSIGELEKLTDLNLSENHLGSVPYEMGELQNLQKLNLSRNNLSSLPGSIKNLKGLNITVSKNENKKLIRELKKMGVKYQEK